MILKTSKINKSLYNNILYKINLCRVWNMVSLREEHKYEVCLSSGKYIDLRSMKYVSHAGSHLVLLG